MATQILPIVGLALGLLYLRGILFRRRRIVGRTGSAQVVLFVSGLAVLLIATLPPLANLGTRLFYIHQIQHMALRLLGPILIALAHPGPVLIAGLPRRIRRAVWRPLRAKLVRLTFGEAVWRAPLILLLAVATIIVAEVPSIHNAALDDPALRSALHAALLAFGLALFVMLFDPGDLRDGVVATAQGARIYLLLGLILSNILIGALTTLKEVVVYTGYDANGRSALIDPLVDETAGGYTIWVPSSWLCLLAIIVVFSGWNRAEERQIARRFERPASNSGSNYAALMFPETAEELRLKVEDPNRKMAQTLGMGTAFIFVLVVSTAITVLTLH